MTNDQFFVKIAGDSMKFLREIKAVSEFLFFAEGILILAALLFWKNDILVYQSELFLRSIDLPFAFNALLFAAATVRLAFVPKDAASESDELQENPILDAVVITAALLIFGLLLFLDLGFPDKI